MLVCVREFGGMKSVNIVKATTKCRNQNQNVIINIRFTYKHSINQ